MKVDGVEILIYDDKVYYGIVQIKILVGFKMYSDEYRTINILASSIVCQNFHCLVVLKKLSSLAIMSIKNIHIYHPHKTMFVHEL